MMRLAKTISVIALSILVAGSVAYARGGGGGGGGRGGGGGGGRGGGGGGRGGMGGAGRGGGMGAGRGTGTGAPGAGAGRFAGKKGATGDQALQDFEDRVALMNERRARLADADRAASMEAKLAALRLSAADVRVGDDVR
jgi:hypothetical protein